MAFNGSEGGPIALNTASEWTANYRENNPGETKGHFFGRDILEQILAQPDCMGIRMYYAIDGDGAKQLVLVGAEANEDDQVAGIVADLSKPCPELCGRANELNS